jgi:hypothetical protein
LFGEPPPPPPPHEEIKIIEIRKNKFFIYLVKKY